MFHTRYTLRGTGYLLHRMGWSVQVPRHRAVERDEAAIATWWREVWPAGKRYRRSATPGSASRTRPVRRCAHRRPAPGADPGGSRVG
ncbi:winged helix-turn-helix domain-containing protein [Micromonospora sp. NBC_00389]